VNLFKIKRQFLKTSIVLETALKAEATLVEVQQPEERMSKNKLKNKRIPVALVCERTMQTERLPLVGEVSTNFCG
jgi:hypothetical protein